MWRWPTTEQQPEVKIFASLIFHFSWRYHQLPIKEVMHAAKYPAEACQSRWKQENPRRNGELGKQQQQRWQQCLNINNGSMLVEEMEWSSSTSTSCSKKEHSSKKRSTKDAI
jgi:hypothetical protein